MKINGEAIYNSRRYTHFAEGENIRYTQSKDGKNIYAFVFQKPGKQLLLTKVPAKPMMKAKLLGSNSKVNITKMPQGIALNLSAGAAENLNHVWVFKLTIP